MFGSTFVPSGGSSNSASREILKANRTYYVSTTGSDSNDGLSAGSPFLTIQKAINVSIALDLSIYSVTIQLADGTYTGANIAGNYIGKGAITILGNETTPANVVISVTSNHCFNFDGVNRLWILRGMKLTTTTSGSAIWADNGAYVQFKKINFGAMAAGGNHIYCSGESKVVAIGDYEISGGAATHIQLNFLSYVFLESITITLTGTPAFNWFCLVTGASGLYAYGITFVGAATGQRYYVYVNAWVQTFGAGALYLPGNTAGATASGGQYV